jgi:heme o synthase
MTSLELVRGQTITLKKVKAYVEVLKPLPSLLLAFIGVGGAIIAGSGGVSPRLALVAAAVLIASAGANGLTNYLDRDLDARMRRTGKRALAAKLIDPPQKVLPLLFTLMGIGLVFAWFLHPYAFIADLAGTLTAATWRKKITCVYPQGVIASCAPLLMGWFAVTQALGWQVLLLCLMIAAWLPLHVWSIIIANREDYLHAGLTFFPISCSVKKSVRILLVFSLALFTISLGLYYIGAFGWIYLAAAITLGTTMVFGSFRLARTGAIGDAWKLYKLSSFPYLGLIFLAMCLDIWLVH